MPEPRSFAFTSEHVLGTLGCTIAIASGSFALYMNLYGPSQPNVNGREYLTIFAQGRQKAQAEKISGITSTADATDPLAIDLLPTGSIARSGVIDRHGLASPSGERAEPLPPSPLKNFRLRDVFDDTALIEDHQQLRIAKVGTVLAGAGRVTSIEQRNGHWIVVTSEGIITDHITSDK